MRKKKRKRDRKQQKPLISARFGFDLQSCMSLCLSSLNVFVGSSVAIYEPGTLLCVNMSLTVQSVNTHFKLVSKINSDKDNSIYQTAYEIEEMLFGLTIF